MNHNNMAYNRTIRRPISQQNSTSNAAKPKKPYTYGKIFEKTLHTRLKFYGRLSFMLAVLLATVLSIQSSKFNIFLFPVKISLIWFGFILIRFSRDITLTVSSSTYTNMVQEIIGDLLSSNFLTCLVAYSISNLLIFLLLMFQRSFSFKYYIESATKTIKPMVNDQFVYFWFYLINFSLIYSLQFLILGKNKLNFKIGVFRTEPIPYLQSLNWVSVLKESLSISGFISLITPILYYLSRGVIFKIFLFPVVWLLNLNSQLPKFHFSIFFYLNLFIITLLVTLSYEVLNKIYNAYSMVGCLHLQKPLSYHSEDPLTTLLSGLKDLKNPFVRTTAFQELAYLTSSNDLGDRAVFYKNTLNWQLILEQCSIVINNATQSFKSNLPSTQQRQGLSVTTASNINNLGQQSSAPEPISSSIFGNSGEYNKSPFGFGDDDIKQSTINPQLFESKTINPDDLFLKPQGTTEQQKAKHQVNKIESNLMEYLKNMKTPELFQRVLKSINQKDTNKYFAEVETFIADKFRLVDKLFTRSLARESNKRLPNKSVLGNSIISISELLLHSKNEDKKNLTLLNLTETLTLLTKVYKSSLEFLTNPPIAVPSSDADLKNCSIQEINELSLSYFFKLVILYNSTLNDLILPPEVFKFAKWCIDSALEEQKANQLKSGI